MTPHGPPTRGSRSAAASTPAGRLAGTRALPARAAGGRYVYGIVRPAGPLRIGPLGVGARPAPVRLVVHRRLAALVSDVGQGPLDPTRENLLAHERVNEAVLRQQGLLPMAFGTVLGGDDDVVEFLKGAYDPLRRAMGRMEGHVEYAVKLLCDRDQLVRSLEREDEDLRRLRQEISTQHGASYFTRIQYGRLVDTALQQAGERAAALVQARLREAAADVRLERPLGDRVVLSLAVLIPRDRQAVFDARLAQLGHELQRMTLRCTGPFPPYSFVRLRVRLDGAER